MQVPYRSALGMGCPQIGAATAVGARPEVVTSQAQEGASEASLTEEVRNCKRRVLRCMTAIRKQKLVKRHTLSDRFPCVIDWFRL